MSQPETHLTIAEETLSVDKRQVTTGKVRVRTETDHVEELIAVSLERGNVEIERVEINQEVSEAPPVRTEGDLTIVPILEEVLIVEKRLILKEEIHLKRRVSTEEVEVPVTTRKQRAVVERLQPGSSTPSEED